MNYTEKLLTNYKAGSGVNEPEQEISFEQVLKWFAELNLGPDDPALQPLGKILTKRPAKTVFATQGIIERELIIGVLRRLQDTAPQLDQVLLHRLMTALESAQIGRHDPLLVPTPRPRGGGKRQPIESACIDIAVRYSLTAAADIIQDRQPIHTIQMAFGGENIMAGGLARRTIHTWISERRSRLSPFSTADSETPYKALRIAGWAYTTTFSRAAKAREV